MADHKAQNNATVNTMLDGPCITITPVAEKKSLTKGQAARLARFDTDISTARRLRDLAWESEIEKQKTAYITWLEGDSAR